MKLIPLTQGKFAKVDDQDYDRLASHKWCLDNGYAVRKVARQKVYMHHEILPAAKGMDVRHINRDRLDNRRSNLEVATRAQTNFSGPGMRSIRISRFKGVHWRNDRGTWRVEIPLLGGGKKYIGSYPTEEEAARVYNEEAPKYQGKGTFLNKV